MSYADKFRKDSEEKLGLVTRFPIALKPSQSSEIDPQQPQKWMQVVAEETQDENGTGIDLENVTILHSQQKVQWKNLLLKLLGLGDQTIWRVLVLVLIILNFVQVSYAYIFLRDASNTYSYYSILVCDAIYMVDFGLAVTIYLWKNLQLRIINPPRNKLTLICDGFLVLPYSFFYEIIYKDNYTSMFIILRSISFLRLFHLMRFFREKSKSAGTNHWKYFITQYFIYFFLLQHGLACIWYLLACPLECTIPGGWAAVLQEIDRYPETHFQWYVTCMYFALINITTVGFGDIIATNTVERIVAALTMALGFTLTTGVFIGTLTSQFVNSSLRKELMRSQIAAIRKHTQAIELSREKVKQIMSYYYILWTKKKGIREAEDIKLLPKPLRMEICFDVNICLLQCSLIFRDKPESFLRTVSLKMKHEFYQTGESIYHQHVIKYKMVCVASGVVEILSDEDNQSPIISFAAGTCIGESALVLTLPARATMRAASYTEVQALYKKDFLALIESFPEIFMVIRKQIFERVKDAKLLSATEVDRETVTLSLYVSHNRQLSAIRKLKDRLNPKTAYTFDNTDTFYRKCLPLYRYSDNIRKAKTRHVCLSENFPWIMQPNTSLTWTWEILIIVNTFLIGILYPYYIAFHRGFPAWLDRLSILLEILNVLDIYIILTTAITEKDSTIQTFKGILLKRLDTIGFYLDVFAAFYIEVFAYVTSDEDHWFYILKINRMLKMYRIVKFFRHLERSLTAPLVTIRLIKYPTYLIMCPYWFGAILYLETCFYEVCDENGWFHKKLLEELEDRLMNPCTANIVHISVYYALTCLSSIGYGDISVGNMKDLITVCCGILIGIFIFGYCTAEFSATFTHNLKKKTDFQETLYAVKNFMNDKHMHPSIKKRVLKFFVLQWYYNEGVGVTNKQALLYNATWKIQHDVLVKERMETITSVPLFYDTDQDFLQLIATGSRVVILPPNEMVTYAGGLSREMYIIQKGYCEQRTGKGELQIIGPLAHFGSASLLYGKISLSTVRTITHVKLISIEFSTFTKALSMFPAIAKELHDIGEDIELLHKLHGMDTTIYSDVKHATPDHEHQKFAIRTFKQLEELSKGSFINVRKHCKKNGEDYNKPFTELGGFFWVKYFLLPICISPNGLFIKFWVTLRLIAACMICYFTPYQFIQSPYFPLLDRTLFGLDLVAYLDLYIMMFVGYYGKQQQLIIHPYKTAVHYLKGLFIIDVVLCAPWELLVKMLIADHNEGHSEFAHSLSPHVYHCLYRSFRVLQIYKLPKVFQYLEKDITKKGDILQIFKFVPFTLMFVNMWACIVVITSCKYYHVSDFPQNIMINGSAQPAGMALQRVSEYTMWCKEDSWIDRSQYHYYTKPYQIFITAIYWCTSTLVGSGFGDITAQDKIHLLIVMCMIIFGVLFFGYIYASISSHKAGLHSTLSQYQEMLKELKEFMEYEKVHKTLQTKIINYYEYRWKRTGGTEPNIILANLHTALLEDAVLYMYEGTLREVPLFEHVERSFFRVIGKELRERYYTRGQTIIRANDVQDNVFIIYRGKVEVISSYNEMQTYMGVGGLFGNITPQRTSKCKFTITAVRNLDCLFVPTQTFYGILKRYPSVKKKMDVIILKADGYIMPTTIITESDSTTSYQRKDTIVTEETSFTSKIEFSKSSGSTVGGTTATSSGVTSATAFLLPHKWCRVALLPDALIFTIFSYITLIAAYINSIVVTYQFAFQHHTANLLAVAVLLDVTFILKIFIDMHKAYIDRYGEYITDNRKIRSMYFKEKKLRSLEFIINIPLYYAAFFLPLFSKLNPYLMFTSIRLITLFRCYYIVEFYKIRANKLMANTLNLKISTIIMWITLIAHFLACIWYLFACPLTYCLPKSWLTSLPDFDAKSKFDTYILCIYYIVNILTTTGTGDILPNWETEIEIIYVIIIMVLTKFFIGIFIGDVTSVLNAYTSSLVGYEYGINELRDYLHNENVSEHQMEKMWRYVRQLWTRSRGKQMPRLIKQLPYVIKCDLMNEIYGQHLRHSYIFSGTEEPFIRQLCALTEHVIFFPGNYIVQHGDSDQSMYFIHRGEVDILTVLPNLTETIHDILCAGEMFGIAQGLYHGVPHHFSFRARTTVDIMLLHLNKWQDLLKLFPFSKDLIYYKAEKIYTKQ